ncbi:CYTH domain-containing protein, partial [Kitasatospora sp. NPDC059571]|uniref:CYTH domain-containing protein n=1 Tax=Kitasatospora sp. NPDC059571 TaxID=3346871 RepID=UPI0036B4DB97
MRLDAVYFDTPDLRMLRRGVTLRRRTGGHDAGWHLKTPNPDGSRTETRLPVESGNGQRPPRELAARAAVHAGGSARGGGGGARRPPPPPAPPPRAPPPPPPRPAAAPR